MDFDHRPGEEKCFQIGQQYNVAWDKFCVEVLKCDLVCANCHRTRTKMRLNPTTATVQC